MEQDNHYSANKFLFKLFNRGNKMITRINNKFYVTTLSLSKKRNSAKFEKTSLSTDAF